MPIEPTLQRIEAQLQQMQSALLSSDATTLHAGAEQLRGALLELARASADAGDPGQWAAPLRLRCQTLAGELARLREQLARVLALTERQAQVLLPPARDPTYGAPSGAPARIYRAP